MSEEDPRPNANAEVARLFAEIGDILEIKGEPPYRYNAYRTAARSVGNATERLDALFEQGRLRELHGVGNALEAKIVEYLTTGRMQAYERERRDFPIALASLLQVPGLGPGRARALYRSWVSRRSTNSKPPHATADSRACPGSARKPSRAC